MLSPIKESDLLKIRGSFGTDYVFTFFNYQLPWHQRILMNILEFILRWPKYQKLISSGVYHSALEIWSGNGIAHLTEDAAEQELLNITPPTWRPTRLTGTLHLMGLL